jgi:hypothetical protein
MDDNSKGFDKTIFTKTAKGVSESSGKARALPRELRDILKEVDGTSSVEDLASVLGMPGDKLEASLRKLAAEDYIHEFVPPALVDDEFDLGPASTTGTGDPLTEVTMGSFLRAAGELAHHPDTQQEAAEEKSRRDAEETARREAEEELRRVSERARHAEEERARRAAERQAKREAREQARKAKEAAAQAAAERKSARQGTGEEHMQGQAKHAGRRSGRKHEAHQDHDAGHERAVGMAADPVVSIDTREPYRAPFRWPFAGGIAKRWRKPVAVAVPLVLLAGAAVALLTSYDGKRAQFESLASAQLGQPVKIGAVRLAPLPLPHWKLENVTIGKDGQIRAPRIDLRASLESLFGEQSVYRSAELTSPVLNEEGLGWLVFGLNASSKDRLRFQGIRASGARFQSGSVELPVFNLDASFHDDGSWKAATVESDDKTLHLNLKPQRDTVQFELVADTFTPPFGAPVKLDSFHATGSASRTGLTVPTWSGKLLGGFVEGRAALSWAAGWKLEGNVRAIKIDTPPLAPQLFEGGKLDGNASFSMEAPAAGKLLPALRESGRLDGSISIHNGALLGVNVATALRGISAGGRSPFVLIESGIGQEQGRTRLRDLHAGAGAITLTGNLDVDTADRLNGHFAIDLQTPSRQTRAFLNLGGTLAEPRFHK